MPVTVDPALITSYQHSANHSGASTHTPSVSIPAPPKNSSRCEDGCPREGSLTCRLLASWARKEAISPASVPSSGSAIEQSNSQAPPGTIGSLTYSISDCTSTLRSASRAPKKHLLVVLPSRGLEAEPNLERSFVFNDHCAGSRLTVPTFKLGTLTKSLGRCPEVYSPQFVLQNAGRRRRRLRFQPSYRIPWSDAPASTGTGLNKLRCPARAYRVDGRTRLSGSTEALAQRTLVQSAERGYEVFVNLGTRLKDPRLLSILPISTPFTLLAIGVVLTLAPLVASSSASPSSFGGSRCLEVYPRSTVGS
ncbi:hypothetical protein NMY22_g8507 [Coprinellus aureogranulatus]|nr:hypothetical protein NMY22_g8507 [Coprinellus aureogranulatus]